jgi:RNA polymerase sigma-70 factor, ECF subfamily
MQGQLAIAATPGMIDKGTEGPDSADAQDRVRRAALGDHAAFEALMLRYQRQVQGTALRLLGNPDDARDAAQEVFLKLHRYLRTLDPGRPVGAWLYRVTINACHDLRRKRRRRELLHVGLDRVDDDPAGAVRGDIDERIASSQEWRLLQSALETLSEKERAAIVLRDVEGLETHEVARILGISEVTVRSHVSRARVRLRREIDRARRVPK